MRGSVGARNFGRYPSIPPIDMFAHRFARAGARGRLSVLSLALLTVAACGGLGCPDAFTAVDGVCVKLNDQREPDEPREPTPTEGEPERCDGEDNDLDRQVDELWPELGEPCGSSVGECEAGVYVCTADGLSIECEGAVGPSVEICDGLDNDCDGVEDNAASPELCNGVDDDCNGLIDDGVLSLKQESLDGHATVAVAGNHYVVTQMLPNDVRVETYDTQGNRTGRFDDTPRLDSGSAFIESAGSEGRVVVGYGQHRFYVLDVAVDDDGIPVILDQVRLHSDWDQGELLGVFNPPFHPRVSASPARFVGFSDVLTFSMTPLGDAPTTEAGLPPIAVDTSLFVAQFDVAGTYAAWEQQGNVRAGWLSNDGTFSLVLDVGRGGKPSIAVRDRGPAVAFVQDFGLRLSELNGFSLQCESDRLCNAPIDLADFEPKNPSALGLGYLDSAEAWLVPIDDRLFVVGRVDGRAVVQQAWESPVGTLHPNRADVEISGNTAAVIQSSEEGDSVLSFVGCF